MKEINILGTPYTVKEDGSILKSHSADGLCMRYNREILILPKEMMLDNRTDKEQEIRYKEVLRHELVHAYFAESGLSEYELDETLVDWIASQLPKIVETCRKLDCI